jgi:hypothetical protein
MTLEALGQFGIDEDEGLIERVGQGGIGAGPAARLLGFRLGTGGLSG